MNIGTALFVNSDTGAAAIGMQGMTSPVSTDPSGSLFQQLISQMLAGQGLTSEAAGENILGGAQNKSGETGGTLSELLLAGGNLTGLKLQTAGREIGGLTAAKGQKDAAEAGGDNNAMEALQALMGGLVQPVQVSDSDAAVVNAQNQSVSDIGNILAAAGGKNPGIMTNGKTVLDNTDGNLLQEILAEDTAGQKAGAALFGAEKASADSNQRGTGHQTSAAGETFTVLTDIDPQTEAAYGQADLKNGLQQASLEIQPTESGNGKSAADTGDWMKEGITAQSDKSSDSTEIQDGSRPVTEYQASLQGAGTSGTAAEQNPSVISAEKAEPYSQIGDKILSKLEQKGPMEFKMQLEPEDLGQIDVNLKLSDGKLMIDILAANAKTQALLTSQVDKLISSMGLQNVQVESVQVNQQMNSQSQNSQNQNYSMNAGMDFSQNRHHEQYQGDPSKGASLTGTFGSWQNETLDSGMASRIESFRYDSHRMNYTV